MGRLVGCFVTGCAVRLTCCHTFAVVRLDVATRGDTINMAARMMQKCPSGELQFGEITKDHLPGWVPTKLRGEVEMKGKGPALASAAG